MTNMVEFNEMIARAIANTIAEDLIATSSVISPEVDLTVEKHQQTYIEFQRQYAHDIWQGLVDRNGGARMLAAGREEAIVAIEEQLDLGIAFRPGWLISSKNAPQDHGLVFFACRCLCHGSGSGANRFETSRGDWCCRCSSYIDI